MATPSEIQKYLEELLAETQKLVRELKERGGTIDVPTLGSVSTPTVVAPIARAISGPPVAGKTNSRPAAKGSDFWSEVGGWALILAAAFLLFILWKSC